MAPLVILSSNVTRRKERKLKRLVASLVMIVLLGGCTSVGQERFLKAVFEDYEPDACLRFNQWVDGYISVKIGEWRSFDRIDMNHWCVDRKAIEKKIKLERERQPVVHRSDSEICEKWTEWLAGRSVFSFKELMYYGGQRADRKLQCENP